MTSYPVLFGYRDVVPGRTFVAFIRLDGRALLTREDDGYWLYGVYPGGIAGGGKEIAEASRELKKSYLSVVFDIANEADSFEAFKHEVEQTLSQRNGPTEREWDAAHAQVTGGQLSSAELPRRDAASRPPRIDVLRIDEAAERDPAQFNRFDTPIALADHYSAAA